MRLTIDTSADSKEDIRRVIRFLQLIVNERDYRNDFRKAEVSEEAQTSSAAALGQFLNKIEREPINTKEEGTPSFKLDFF